MYLTTRRPNIMKSDVRERQDDYLLDIDLPGCNKEDVKIYLEDGYLVVTAEINKKTEEDKGKLVRSERYSGKYQRSWYVGDKIFTEDISASYKNGVLTIVVPKQSKRTPEKATISIN